MCRWPDKIRFWVSLQALWPGVTVLPCQMRTVANQPESHSQTTTTWYHSRERKSKQQNYLLATSTITPTSSSLSRHRTPRRARKIMSLANTWYQAKLSACGTFIMLSPCSVVFYGSTRGILRFYVSAPDQTLRYIAAVRYGPEFEFNETHFWFVQIGTVMGKHRVK